MGRTVGNGEVSRSSSIAVFFFSLGFICSRCRGARRGARGARGVRQFTRCDGAIARATSPRDEWNRAMARRDARGARSAPGGRRANPLIRARPRWLTGWCGEVGRGRIGVVPRSLGRRALLREGLLLHGDATAVGTIGRVVPPGGRIGDAHSRRAGPLRARFGNPVKRLWGPMSGKPELFARQFLQP